AEGPALVLPHHHLQAELARGEREARAVLDALLPHVGPAHAQRVADPGHRPLRLVAHAAREAERRLFLVAGPRKGERRSRHRDGERDVEAVLACAEVAGLHPDREVARGEVGEELVLELTLPVLLPGVPEVAVGVVAGAVLDAEVGPADLDPDTAELAVL